MDKQEECGCVEIGVKGKIPKYCEKHLKEHLDKGESWEKEFEERYCAFEISERISITDMENIKSFIKDLRSKDRDTLIKRTLENSFDDPTYGTIIKVNLVKQIILEVMK